MYTASVPDVTAADAIGEIRESFAVIEPRGAEATAWFYEHFFAWNPRYHKLFAGIELSGDLTVQHRRLFQAVQRIVADLDHLEQFLPEIRRLALRHRKLGLRAAHYEAFGRSLVAAAEHFAAPVWTPRTRAAWEAGYGLVADVMLEASAEANKLTAPYWEAEVVGHEMLGGRIARLTLRVLEDPDLPGPYTQLAGQYAALESPALIRVWRDFSFAGSPRADGLVEFHIQSGRPGGVSDALVHRTGVGDRLRIASAEGELAFPAPHTPGLRAVEHLIAVAHGTGAAPVAALVEAAIEADDLRPIAIMLVVDADGQLEQGRAGGHYLAAHFAKLAARHGAMQIEQVVGDPLPALRARLAAAPLGPAEGCGAVLVGPGAMIDACRAALAAAGTAADRIASDLFG